MHVALEDGFVVSSTMIMGYWLRVTSFGLIIAISVSFASAQTASTQAPQATFAATSAHVAQPGSPVSIRIFRWSTEEERAPLIAALNTPPPPPPAPAPPPPAATPAPAAPPPDGDAAPAPDRGNAGRAGRAGRGGGRDGRGGRGDAPPPPPPPITPIGALTNAIAKAPTIGYIWTDEATGYSIKYAYRLPLPAGGERVVLATSRVLGGGSIQWKPTEPTTEYRVHDHRASTERQGARRRQDVTHVQSDRRQRRQDACDRKLRSGASDPAERQKGLMSRSLWD